MDYRKLTKIVDGTVEQYNDDEQFLETLFDEFNGTWFGGKHYTYNGEQVVLYTIQMYGLEEDWEALMSIIEKHFGERLVKVQKKDNANINILIAQ